MIGIVFLVIHFVSASSAWAAGSASSTGSSSSSSSRSGVGATVTTDGAIVYASPSQESAVLAQLPTGSRVRVSKGATAGPEKFHKVRIGNRIGWIDDIDIAVDGANPPKPPPGMSKKNVGRDGKPKKRRTAKRKFDKPEKPPDPMYFSRFVGVALGVSEFKEGILNVNSSTSFAVYGLKMTGPDFLFHGPVMDINLLLHYGAPSYYTPISATQPNGFVLFTDAMFQLPIFQVQDAVIYLEAGPLLVISKFGVVNSNRVMSLDEVNLGADAAIGGGFRVGKVAVRLEAKYYLEKQDYKAFLAAVQTQF